MTAIYSGEFEYVFNDKWRTRKFSIVQVIPTPRYTLLRTFEEEQRDGTSDLLLFESPLLAVGIEADGHTVPFAAPGFNADELFEGACFDRMAICAPDGFCATMTMNFPSREEFFDNAFELIKKHRDKELAPLRKGIAA